MLLSQLFKIAKAGKWKDVFHKLCGILLKENLVFHLWNLVFHGIYGKVFSTSGILSSMEFVESHFPLVESCFPWNLWWIISTSGILLSMEFMENYIPLVEACFPWNLRKINSTSGILSSMEFVINYFHKWNLVFDGISTSGMFSFMEFMEKYFPKVESCFPYNLLKVIFHKWNMAFHRIYGKSFFH